MSELASIAHLMLLWRKLSRHGTNNWATGRIHALDKLNAASSLQALLPLLERVRELAQSDPRLGQDLQPLLQCVELVLRDCHTCMQEWNKPGATGVRGPRQLTASHTCLAVMHQCQAGWLRFSACY
jgi:hypothetical protein